MAGAKLKDGDILLISDAIVATEPADAAAYEAIYDASTPIANVVTAPAMGYSVNTSSHDYLDSEFSSPDKGIAVGSSSDIVFGLKPGGDAGQTLVDEYADPGEKGRVVLTIKRLDGSAVSAWGIISGHEINGGGNGTHNEVTSTFTVAAKPVSYTPT